MEEKDSKAIAELKGFSGGYEIGKPIVKNANAIFRTGEITAIIGPNGSGKTTILKALLGQLPWSDGQASLFGNNISTMPTREIARKVAFMGATQSENEMTVLQNCLLGRTPHRSLWAVTDLDDDLRIANLALESTGVAHLADRRLSNLSEGQKKLAYLARALAQTPTILLLDEPTANLDPQNTREVLEITRLMAKKNKMAVVAVVHDINIAATWADSTLLIKDGTLTQVQQLDAETLSRIYETQIIESVCGDNETKIFSTNLWDLRKKI